MDDKSLKTLLGDLQSILDQLHLGILMTDEYGCITFQSKASQELLGKEQNQIIGLPWPEVFSMEGETIDALKSMLSSPQEKRKKVPFFRMVENGQQYWMEIDVKEDPRAPRRKIFFIHDVSEVHYLRQQLQGRAQFQDLIGKSKGMKMVYQQIQDLAGVDSTVLIEGDTGTGKELVARALHFSSYRKMNPFMVVNCAGLMDSLIESQLYGHRRGAFTGAVSDQVGLFEAADGGSLFLDEVGDIPLNLQTNFLRAIQEKEILRIGEFKTIPVNVRIIAATNRDLNIMVSDGRFRADLFYRINVARIRLPLLRERREDIPLLVKTFLKQFQLTHRSSVEDISENAMRKLLDYHWPGNVRELRSAIEFAVIQCKQSKIEPEDLPTEVIHPPVYQEFFQGKDHDFNTRLMAALEKTGGNRSRAAQMLGIGRATLYRHLEKLGLDH